MTEVAVLVFEDCQSSAVATVIEALNIGNLHWALTHKDSPAPFTWRTVSFDGRPVRGMGGIELVPDAPSDKLGQPDLIFLPAVQAGERGTMTKAVQRLARQGRCAERALWA